MANQCVSSTTGQKADNTEQMGLYSEGQGFLVIDQGWLWVFSLF